MRASAAKKNGPARVPTKILEARGSTLTYKRDSRTEPPLDPAMPPCPPWVQGKARAWWKKISPQLAAVGLLTEIDGVMLGALADALADYLEAKDPKATSLRARREARKHLVQLAREFGLSPSSRAGLSLPRETPPHGNSSEAKDKARFFRIS
jgi:phage terminase small subunit